MEQVAGLSLSRTSGSELTMAELEGRGEITRLLGALRAGDPTALDRLVPLVYDELKRRAHWQLVGGDSSLSTTALVHETYLKLLDASAVVAENRAHFYHVAAKAMRQIVVDYARKRLAAKRGGGARPLCLDEARLGVVEQAEEVVALHAALDRLEGLDPRLAEVVELRFFGGLSVEEVAEALAVTPRTVKRDWRKARTFLYQEMRGGGVGAGPG
jgi:RNA polymerase sigma factor (TIGR02999 family)